MAMPRNRHDWPGRWHSIYNREGAGEISFSVCGGSRRILCLSARRTRTGHSRRRHARRLCGDGDGRSDRHSGWRSCWRRHWRRRWLARHLSGRAAGAGVSSPKLYPAFISLLPSQTHDRLKRLYGGRAALESPLGLAPILWGCPWGGHWGIRPLLIPDCSLWNDFHGCAFPKRAKHVSTLQEIDKRVEQFRQLLRLALLPAEREHVDRRIERLGDERARFAKINSEKT